MAVTALILALGLPLTSTLPGFWYTFFSTPAAYTAGMFMGASCVATPDGSMLINDALPVHVTLSCSAGGFFVLILALVAGLVTSSPGRAHPAHFFMIVPLCYGVTVTANTARIVTAWYTGRWARQHLPEDFWDAVHFGAGVLVFLVFMTALYGIAAWRLKHDAD